MCYCHLITTALTLYHQVASVHDTSCHQIVIGLYFVFFNCLVSLISFDSALNLCRFVFCLAFINEMGKVTAWTCPNEGLAQLHLPSMNQKTVAQVQAGWWSIESGWKKNLLIGSPEYWGLQGSKHNLSATTALAAPPSGQSSVVVLSLCGWKFAQYLHNLHDHFVPCHCQCYTNNALRNHLVWRLLIMTGMFMILFNQSQFHIHCSLLFIIVPVFTAI
jgi:hypothetical protein